MLEAGPARCGRTHSSSLEEAGSQVSQAGHVSAGGARGSSQVGNTHRGCRKDGSYTERPRAFPGAVGAARLRKEGPGLRAGRRQAPFLPWLQACLCILFSSCMCIARPAWRGCPPAFPPASAWPGARSLRNVGTQPRLEGGGQVTQRGHVGRALAQGFEQTLQKWQDAWT